MAEKIKSINLLPQKGGGFVDQFLDWALSIGRLLVILTETLALGTFLYRFSIDMKIIDLHDLIKNERLIVGQYQQSETKYRDLHARLMLSDNYDEKSSFASSVLSDIIEMGRGKVTFKNLTVSNEAINIQAQSSNANVLSSFVNSLKSYPKITSVSINSVENKTSSSQITMNISATIEQANQRP